MSTAHDIGWQYCLYLEKLVDEGKDTEENTLLIEMIKEFNELLMEFDARLDLLEDGKLPNKVYR